MVPNITPFNARAEHKRTADLLKRSRANGLRDIPSRPPNSQPTESQ